MISRIFPRQALDLLGSAAEQKEVFCTDGIPDLDIGPIECADSQRTVERKLHVSSSGCLHTGCRNLLRQVGCRIDSLAVADVEVREKNHLQEATHRAIPVDDICNTRDQTNDELRHLIAWRGLAGKYEGARENFGIGILLDAIVQGDDV